MDIKIAGWTSENLRCPDITVDLSGSAGGIAPVALIQMPNGTGKTTTLKMLNAALGGEAGRWKDNEIRELRRPGETHPSGKFIVRLQVDGRPLTIELTLDFESGTAQYRTTNPGSGGVLAGWKPPPALLDFLSPEFLRLFIFDGEFADRLFDADGAEADRSINALCQLYLVEEISTYAEKAWERKSKDAGPKTDASLTRAKDEEKRLLADRARLERAKAKAEATVASSGAMIREVEGKIEGRLSSGASTRDRHSEAQLGLQRAEGEVALAITAAIHLMRTPVALDPTLGGWLSDLKNSLDTLRLPGNSSAQFFAELMEEAECICGREMSVGAKTEIQSRSKRYLDSDEAGVINSLKSDIDQFTQHHGEDAPSQKLLGALADMKTAVRVRKGAEQALRSITQRLIDDGDDILRGWEKTLEEQRRIFDDHSFLLGTLNADKGEGSIAEVSRQIGDVRDKIASITKTVKLRKQTDLIKAILAHAAAIARETIKRELVLSANERLNVILANDPLRIADIDRCLKLSGQSGASIGQQLSVGYTFLMSVLSRGRHQFPLVVDSPANPLDEGVRRKVGSLIPKLCSQFVGLTINTERPGFVPALQEAAGEVLYLTLFRKLPGTERFRANMPASGITESGNAILVNGREFFVQFDVTEEGGV